MEKEIKVELKYDDGRTLVVTLYELAQMAIEQGDDGFEPWAEERLL